MRPTSRCRSTPPVRIRCRWPRDGLVLGARKRKERRDRAEGLLTRDTHVRACVGQDGGFVEESAARAAAPPVSSRAPWLQGVRTMASTFRSPAASMSGPTCTVRLEHIAGRRRRTARVSGARHEIIVDPLLDEQAGSRRRRSDPRCGTWTARALTAASISASSNTMNGALPPSSSDSLLQRWARTAPSAACRRRSIR
jgi:hypothetical protein